MAALEACQSDPSLQDSLEALAKNLARAQGKLFPASKLKKDAPAAQDMMRGAMDYLAQSLKVIQELGDGQAAEEASDAIAMALKTLHPVLEASKRKNGKKKRRSSSMPPPLAVNVNTMLNVNTDHYFYNGFSENIEEGGIFVATFDPRPIDSKVVVNFKLPGGRPVSARGIVHWVREYNPMNPEMAPGMGVKFTDLLAEDKEAIKEFLTQRAPMFYDE